MIKYKQPQEPAGFEAACRDAKAAVAAAIAANDDDSLTFPDKWANYKNVLSASQHGKCGYCEISVVAGQHGDVEHYRPKGEVSVLLAPGRELQSLGNVRDRQVQVISTRGYWWGAYDWRNYLLSCMNCNQKWKKTLFPVNGTRASRPSDSERALLMSPFHRRNPVNHLYFDELGAVVAVNSSKFGKATIETCGLDRLSLTTARLQQARRAHQLAKALLRAVDSGSDADVETALREVFEAGRPEYQFAGVIRSVMKHDCDMDWAEIEAQVAFLDGP